MARFVLLVLVVVALSGLAASASQARSFDGSCAGAVSWQQAARSIGKTVTLRGHVDGAHYAVWKSGKGSMTFLDFGGRYPHSRFTAVVWNANVEPLNGHTVCARGKVTLYHGKPEMSVASANDVVAYGRVA